MKNPEASRKAQSEDFDQFEHADLSFRLAHMLFSWFCYAPAQIFKSNKCVINLIENMSADLITRIAWNN